MKNNFSIASNAKDVVLCERHAVWYRAISNQQPTTRMATRAFLQIQLNSLEMKLNVHRRCHFVSSARGALFFPFSGFVCVYWFFSLHFHFNRTFVRWFQCWRMNFPHLELILRCFQLHGMALIHFYSSSYQIDGWERVCVSWCAYDEHTIFRTYSLLYPPVTWYSRVCVWMYDCGWDRVNTVSKSIPNRNETSKGIYL